MTIEVRTQAELDKAIKEGAEEVILIGDGRFDRESMEKTLATLEAERAELDTTIEFLRKRLGKFDSASEPINPTTPSHRGSGAQIHHDTFFGMSVIDAAKRYLSIVGKPARSTEDVIKALKTGGIDKDYATVSSTLARAARIGQGIARVGRGKWGLDTWYPNTAMSSGKNTDKEERPEEKVSE